MSLKPVSILILQGLFSFASYGALCVFDTTNPAMPVADCQFKTCLAGGDCEVPRIEKSLARVEMSEPLIQWMERCQDDPAQSSCWQSLFKMRLRVWATDPSGIREIGLHLAKESNARRTFEKVWAPANQKDEQGRYDAKLHITHFVPSGQRIQLSVYEVCARDGFNNEACVAPDSPSRVDTGR